MKKVSRKKLITINLSVLIICAFVYNLTYLNYYGVINNTKVEAKENAGFVEAVIIEPIVYEDMTMLELSEQLEKSMKNELSGYGSVYAKYAIEYGVDPYLALAITLYETGCSGNGCSYVARACNNVGGMVRGTTSCYGSRFGGFNSMEEGIERLIYNIRVTYHDYGLMTPYEMQKKYAGGSTTWGNKVTYFMNKIRNA